MGQEEHVWGREFVYDLTSNLCDLGELSSLSCLAVIKYTLHDLLIILRLLGEDWGYMINDMTEGRDGNFERSAYIFKKNESSLLAWQESWCCGTS